MLYSIARRSNQATCCTYRRACTFPWTYPKSSHLRRDLLSTAQDLYAVPLLACQPKAAHGSLGQRVSSSHNRVFCLFRDGQNMRPSALQRHDPSACLVYAWTIVLAMLHTIVAASIANDRQLALCCLVPAKLKGEVFGALQESIDICRCKTLDPIDFQALPKASCDFQRHYPRKIMEPHMRNVLKISYV